MKFILLIYLFKSESIHTIKMYDMESCQNAIATLSTKAIPAKYTCIQNVPY